jgi:Arylsulfotransferase (ASST)
MFSMRALIVGPTVVLGLGVAVALSPAPATALVAPTCGPSSLDNSALQDGTVTVSPLPGSRDATPQTQISFLGVPAGELSAVTVVGSRTGAHAGSLRAYSQGDGASFLPAHAFAEGEQVTVRAHVRVGGATKSLLDEFVIATQDTITTTPGKIRGGSAAQQQSFNSRPDLHPPTVTVTVDSPAVAPGDVFVAPYKGPGQAGPMILDPSGGLLWFKALPTNTSATNFSEQEYLGKPVLTWWQGDADVHGFGLGEDVIADSKYTDIAHVKAGNGLQADLHEFQITPQGTALITAYDPVYCSISSVGGPTYGAVIDSVFQEIDIKTGLVMYEWTSLAHVGLRESYALATRTTTAEPFDFFHINSISVNRDGSLLVDSRNTWTVYDVNASTGQINWRLGGRHSSFKQGPGTGTAWQHDPRELADGEISIFDNGAYPKVHGQSRGIVVKLEPQSRTATLVTRITHAPAILAESQGNVQALANGDWFLGWGQTPVFSEYSPTGALLFDAHFPATTQSYRDFRFPWTGTPAHPPTFVFKPAAGGGGVVYASWNGATLVTAWRVLAGASAASLQPVAQVPRSGFETAIAIPAASAGPDFAVQALGAAGQVLGTSATAAG